MIKNAASNSNWKHQATAASRCPPQSFWTTRMSSKSCQLRLGSQMGCASPWIPKASVSDRSVASRGSRTCQVAYATQGTGTGVVFSLIHLMRHDSFDSIPHKNRARTASSGCSIKLPFYIVLTPTYSIYSMLDPERVLHETWNGNIVFAQNNRPTNCFAFSCPRQWKAICQQQIQPKQSYHASIAIMESCFPLDRPCPLCGGCEMNPPDHSDMSQSHHHQLPPK